MTSDGKIVLVFILRSFHRPPSNDINLLIYLHESLETLFNRDYSSLVIILGGDFNLPDVLWIIGCGHLNTNPVYDLDINKPLLE